MIHIKTTIRRTVATLGVAGLLALGAGRAHAQQAVAGGTPGWSGYAPGYSWGSAAPSVGGYAPQATTPVYAYPPSAAAWQGYAPTTAWQGYTPGVASAPRARTGGGTAGQPVSRHNREYGTGRTVHMHKPWLPSSPR